MSRKNIEKFVSENDIRVNFILLGRMPDAYRYLKAFDVFVMPSLKEGFPYALLEAGLAKLPVITTNVGGISDIIDEDNGVSIILKDSRHIKNAILNLIDNKDKMKLISEDLYNDVSSKFTFESMYKKTVDVYNS